MQNMNFLFGFKKINFCDIRKALAKRVGLLVSSSHLLVPTMDLPLCNHLISHIELIFLVFSQTS